MRQMDTIFPQMSDRLMSCLRGTLISLVIAIALTVPAFAEYGSHFGPVGNPISPEAAYAEDLSQRIHVHAKVSINRASLNQLEILPGFDQNLALKVLRLRPFRNIDDMAAKMPPSSQHRIQVIRNNLAQAVHFD